MMDNYFLCREGCQEGTGEWDRNRSCPQSHSGEMQGLEHQDEELQSNIGSEDRCEQKPEEMKKAGKSYNRYCARQGRLVLLMSSM
jgi:hypothetical protein